MEDKFNLFDNDGKSPIIPSLEQGLDKGTVSDAELREQLNSSAQLVSAGLERAIQGETVKTLMLAEESEIALPNFVIDVSKVNLTSHQSHGIDALLDIDGDAIIYVYTDSGLMKVGRGASYILDRIIATTIDNLFTSRAKVYKDFQPGEPLRVLSGRNVETLRLNL